MENKSEDDKKYLINFLSKLSKEELKELEKYLNKITKSKGGK
jgi:hypothetical protein